MTTTELLPPGELIVPPKPVLTTKRHSGWGPASHLYVLRYPSCYVCGRLVWKGLKAVCPYSIHHALPFHLYPELEMDEANWVTVCEYRSFNCHFVAGHLLDWRSWNADIRKQGPVIHAMFANRPYKRAVA